MTIKIYAMSDAMEYWIKEFDIDGYRCDVAGMVPIEFWEFLRPRLDSIKPVFMLAEWEDPKLHEKAFDMTYSWELFQIMNRIGKEEENASAIFKQLEKETKIYPLNSFRMRFITNHDENSWNGTEFERLNYFVPPMAALSVTVPGMVLLYSGQEVGLNKRLSFFDKDTIDWNTPTSITSFYSRLLNLKTTNKALLNGEQGGEFIPLQTLQPDYVAAYLRKKDDNKVLVLLNLSNTYRTVNIKNSNLSGEYVEILTDAKQKMDDNYETKLQPWGLEVWSSNGSK
jgi:glycosidase